MFLRRVANKANVIHMIILIGYFFSGKPWFHKKRINISGDNKNDQVISPSWPELGEKSSNHEPITRITLITLPELGKKSF